MRSMLLALFSMVVFASNAQANLLDDGSFTTATSGGQTSNSAWVLTTNFPDSDDAGQFQGGFANAENGSGGDGDGGTGIWFKSFLGNRGGVTSIPTANADVTQSVAAPASGDYLLTFVAGREDDHRSEVFEVSLASGGTGGSGSVDLLAAAITGGNIGGGASPNLGGTPFSVKLTGVTAGDTLTVTGRLVDGIDNVGGGGQSAFLDKFDLTQVPEPTSMLLLGMGSLGLFIRRRR